MWLDVSSAPWKSSTIYLTCAQFCGGKVVGANIYMQYLLQWIAILEVYVPTGSITETRESFTNQFPDCGQPVKKKHPEVGEKSGTQWVQCLMPRTLRASYLHACCYWRHLHVHWEKFEEIHKKNGLSRLMSAEKTCQCVLNKMHMKAYYEPGKHLTYCQWLQASITGGILEPLLFMMDEAWFHLSGHVSSQNTRYLLVLLSSR